VSEGIPSDAARAASGARVLNADAMPEQMRFSTDTRSLAAGETYVALRGPRFDGHAFVGEALGRGARALVVDDAAVVPEGVPAFVVADTTRAYLAFGGVARDRSSARVVAITGSTGKTTTKALLAQLLETVTPGRVVATPANENNEIGVAKFLLALPNDAAYAVVELGARHFGDIEPLARAAKPESAVITNLGEAHLEIFGSRERLIETKWGIFATGARRILNAADAASVARASADARPTAWFSWRADDDHSFAPPGEREVAIVGRDRMLLRYDDRCLSYSIDARLGGDHNLANLAAAVAAALDLGAAPAPLARMIPELTLPSGRYERVALAEGEAIYDAYNASASGMLATLASFAREDATRRIAVLGSMAELGPDASSEHVRVGAAAARAGLARLYVGGDFAGDLERGARDAGFPSEAIVRFDDNAAAVAQLREELRAGDLVLFKASRRYRLETVLEGLRASHA
jgi:UDP-N-acetylmuramoyl-tripeptide--D-alanyl-D-alanine ligase